MDALQLNLVAVSANPVSRFRPSFEAYTLHVAPIQTAIAADPW